MNWHVRFRFPWDDESCNIYMRVRDDQGEDPGWSDKGNWLTENDLIVYTTSITDDQLDPGEILEVTGKVTYEGTTNIYPPNSYWHVHLGFDGHTSDGDWAWCYPYVEYIKAEGVTGGYPDGLYHPENLCTRDQMAVYVSRAFGYTD